MGTRAKRGIELIKLFHERKKKVRLNTVYSNQSEEDIMELLKFAIKNEIDRFSIADYSEVTGFTKITKIYNISDLRKLEEKVRRYLLDNKIDNFNFSVEGCFYFTAFPELIEEGKIYRNLKICILVVERSIRKWRFYLTGMSYLVLHF
ncbi:hypothetical protein ACGO3R_10715 [Lactococcus lactis]